MSERGLPVGESSALACPFVAFEDDRDERSTRPDHRHRCYADIRPAPRALAHQEAFCLASAFPACPTFQDWARREAARERPPTVSVGDMAPDPFGSRPPARRSWAAPPPWAGGDSTDDGGPEITAGDRTAAAGSAGGRAAAGSAGGRAAEDGFAARNRQEGPEGERQVSGERGAAGSLERGPRKPEDEARSSDATRDSRVARPPGRGLADVDPERPWLSAADRAGAGTTGTGGTARDHSAMRDRELVADPDERPERAARREEPSLRGSAWRRDELEPLDDEPDDAIEDADESASRRGGPRPRAIDDRATGLLGGIGGALGRDRRPRVGDSRRRTSTQSEAPRRAPAVSAAVRETLPRDPAAPAWERPRRMEAYPTLKTRMGLPSLPPVALGFAALVVAAIAIFLIPLFLFRSSGDNGGTGAGPSVTPSIQASSSIAPTATPEPSSPTYTVKEGDTLSKIAKHLGVTLDELLAANPQVKDPNKIGLGDQLNIPSIAPSDVTDASPSASASTGP